MRTDIHGIGGGTMATVRIEHIEVGGWDAPHELKIELVGKIDEPVGDDIVLVMREYGREFLESVGPAIAEAFERVFLERLRKGEYKWADRNSPPLASKPAVIEDIEL